MHSHVDLVCPCKRRDFKVISVSTFLAHLIQVILKGLVRVFGSTRIIVESSSLSLGIPTRTTPWMNFNELFIVVVVFPHVVDDTRPEDGVQGFITVNLIGESIEEAVSCSRMNGSVTCRSVVSHGGWWGRLKGGQEGKACPQHTIPGRVRYV